MNLTPEQIAAGAYVSITIMGLVMGAGFATMAFRTSRLGDRIWSAGFAAVLLPLSVILLAAADRVLANLL